MGTSCQIIFIYNGYHYQFYNKYDSFLEWLGERIVHCIRKANEEDIKKWKNLLENIHKKYYGTNYQSEFGESKFEDISITLRSPLYHGLVIHKEEDIPKYYYVDYVYFIDLNKEEFSVMLDKNNWVTYPFKSISQDWVSEVKTKIEDFNKSKRIQ